MQVMLDEANATWAVKTVRTMSLFHPEGAGHSPAPVSPTPF